MVKELTMSTPATKSPGLPSKQLSISTSLHEPSSSSSPPSTARDMTYPNTNTNRPGILSTSEVDSTYAQKASAINKAIQEIGMGRYQWGLFFTCGFGWFMDSLWQSIPGIILPVVVSELRPGRIEYLALAQNLGLAIGSLGWGLTADVVGRRWAFNLTLLLTGLFGLVGGAPTTFAGLAVMVALWSLGVGGNIPVDSAVLLEFLPGSHQWLLSAMNIWWCIGQIFGTGMAWVLFVGHTCMGTGETECTPKKNQGWRYLLFFMGGLTLMLFLIRFFLFSLHESPKFLMGQGNDEAAAISVQKLASDNRVSTNFTAADLSAISGTTEKPHKTAHIRSLFCTPKLIRSSLIIALMWFLTGLGFPLYNAFLPYFLSRMRAGTQKGYSDSMRDYMIILVCNIPGVFLGTVAIEIPSLGRRGVMSLGAIMTGAFLIAGTTAKTQGALLAWNCAYAVAGTMMAGTMYAYTPEVFPTKDRGTGSGLAMAANRLGGIVAPVVAMYANLDTPVPVYVSGAMFLVAGVVMWALPFEGRGKTSL
ncbi:membrane transporter [Pyronema omphalodes]|nr:membrane transporter [Pyronema omphalodes]